MIKCFSMLSNKRELIFWPAILTLTLSSYVADDAAECDVGGCVGDDGDDVEGVLQMQKADCNKCVMAAFI